MVVRGYSLGFLLRKLPLQVFGNHSYRFRLVPVDFDGLNWAAGYTDKFELFQFHDQIKKPISLYFPATTPENAACKLCIELFKQGILKKGNPNG